MEQLYQDYMELAAISFKIDVDTILESFFFDHLFL